MDENTFDALGLSIGLISAAGVVAALITGHGPLLLLAGSFLVAVLFGKAIKDLL